MGALRVYDKKTMPYRQIIHLQCGSHEDCTKAICSLRDSLGVHNVIVLVDSSPEDPRPILCVRATEESLRVAIDQLPRSVVVSYESLSEAKQELIERRLHCLL
jgi:hypothetical protein